MKKTLNVIGYSVIAIGIFKTGEICGQIKMLRKNLNLFDEIIPGAKERMAKEVSDKIISVIFKHDKEEEEES